MQAIKIRKWDLTKELSEKICFLYFVNRGAQGMPGHILFITTDGNIYSFNYLYEDITIEDTIAFFPPLSKKQPKGWRREFSELWGHMVFISETVYEVFAHEIKDKRPVEDLNYLMLPFNWIDTALKVVKDYYKGAQE